MSTVRYEHVRYGYPDGPLVLHDIDLEVASGEVLLLVGASGCGKSTLLRTTNGLVPRVSGGRFGGRVTVGTRVASALHPRELADEVGFVHQDPEAQIVVDRVEGDVAFALENLGMPQRAMRRRVEEVLDALDLARLRERRVSTLSGGERQRVAIAGALASGPSVLVLDEPTSELDPQGAEDVLGAIQRLNLDLGTTVVLAEHRLERAAHMADEVAVMETGRVTDVGEPSTVLPAYPGAPEVTRLGHLLGWDPPPLTVRDARRLAGRSERTLVPPQAASRPVRPGVGDGVRVLLEARDLELVHEQPVLHGVSFGLGAGESLAVLGRNGSGKTTLLRALAGLADPASGVVECHGEVTYVPQDPNTLLVAPTVRRELEETLRLRGLRDEGRVDGWLARLGLTELADRHPRSLSAGERQRVAVAAVAVGGAEVLLLDEPTRGIDAAAREALELAMAEHLGAGGAVVVATHDIELAARLADRVLVLGDGEVVAAGDAREVLGGSLFAPQVLRVLPPFLTVGEVAEALEGAAP